MRLDAVSKAFGPTLSSDRRATRTNCSASLRILPRIDLPERCGECGEQRIEDTRLPRIALGVAQRAAPTPWPKLQCALDARVVVIIAPARGLEIMVTADAHGWCRGGSSRARTRVADIRMRQLFTCPLRSPFSPPEQTTSDPPTAILLSSNRHQGWRWGPQTGGASPIPPQSASIGPITAGPPRPLPSMLLLESCPPPSSLGHTLGASWTSPTAAGWSIKCGRRAQAGRSPVAGKGSRQLLLRPLAVCSARRPCMRHSCRLASPLGFAWSHRTAYVGLTHERPALGRR